MKKIMYVIMLLFLAACAKDALWKQDSKIPDSQKGTISGELTNDDDGKPLKGVKILFERQTQGDGTNSYVDTASTDSEGKFSYKIPYPNKVRLVVRDTGRYMADTALVDVQENKNYTVNMNSYPRFGASQINVQVVDESQKPYPGLKVGLYERENSNESYSAVDTLVADAQGKVIFTSRAFPVRYKVKIVESDIAYKLDSLEGALLTKEPVNVVLKTSALFGTGDLKIVSQHWLSGFVVKNEKFQYRYKSIMDATYSAWTDAAFDAEGKYTLTNKLYPGNIEIRSSSNSKVRFNVENSNMILSEANLSTAYAVTIKDLEPRYSVPVLSNILVSTLVLNNELSVKGPFAITKDKNHNLYIADGYKNQLFMVDAEGNASVIAGTGVAGTADGLGTVATFNGMWGVAVDSSGVIYTTDAANVTGAHRVRKIVKNANGTYTVSTIAGTGTAGSANGSGTAATFNRPSGIVFDKTRNCLYVSEWAVGTVRKIDLSTSANTVSTLATISGAINLFAMALTPDHKEMYISSNNNTSIFRYNFASNTVAAYQNTSLNNRGLFVTEGNKLLATAGNQHSVFYYDLTTNQRVILSLQTAGDLTGVVIKDSPIESTQFNQPFGIYYDAWTGNWYVSNNTNNASNTGSVRVLRSKDI